MPRDIFKSLSQREIIEAIHKNDDAVLEQIYQDGFPKVRKYVRENQGNEEEAKDIFQEAFIAMWQNVKRGVFAPANPTALQGYLFQIAKNKWVDRLRSNNKKMMLDVTEIPDQIDEDSHDSEPYFRQLEQVFLKLGETCRELLTGFYFRKESLASLARHFGWSEATAKNNKYRCMERLRAALNASEE